MTYMTPKMARDYAAGGRTCCPYCKSDRIRWWEAELGNRTEKRVTMLCLACGQTWEDWFDRVRWVASTRQLKVGRLLRVNDLDVRPVTVLFRWWQDAVIAIFPDLREGEGGLCQSYEHIGQHGLCDPHHIIQNSRPARPEEYASLQAELEDQGYLLKVRKKMAA